MLDCIIAKVFRHQTLETSNVREKSVCTKVFECHFSYRWGLMQRSSHHSYDTNGPRASHKLIPHKAERPQQPPFPLVHTSPNEIHDNSHDIKHMTAAHRFLFFFFFPRPFRTGGSPSPQPVGVTETWGSSGDGVTAWIMASLVNAPQMTFVWITELVVKHLHCGQWMVSL